jgi:hypothetical protein
VTNRDAPGGGQPRRGLLGWVLQVTLIRGSPSANRSNANSSPSSAALSMTFTPNR